jgi:hypothetical protein
MLVADTAQELAALIADLMLDRDLRGRVAEAGQAFVRRRYVPGQIQRRLESIGIDSSGA